MLASRPAQLASYRRDIDGLRAIAILPVMLFHVGEDAFSGGFLGVDVFFVVSGFLITGLIAPEIAAGRFSYVSFWERRARRLLPAMFTVVAATAFVAYWMLLPSELEAFGQSILSLVLFSSNFYFWLHTRLLRGVGAVDSAASYLVARSGGAVLSPIPRNPDGGVPVPTTQARRSRRRDRRDVACDQPMVALERT